ncbi:MAG: flagellar biosynthetic protein FliO [Acidobacteria bacterium]|nr:flagellar biosynthetic protein FliO [Acidobacteriota bacterium]
MVLAQMVVPGVDPVPINGQALAAMAVVLGLLVLASWLLRRGTLIRRSKQPVSVETAVALGDRRSLVIVAVEGRRLLIGLTPGQISLVTELQPPFASTLEASVEKGASS